ncbi:MAG TPA: M56 family metallopeptidase, partial [Pseudomonadales bacterium]|nr:M56 family metallopeptidase [Pseudomonadales bacterium]
MDPGDVPADRTAALTPVGLDRGPVPDSASAEASGATDRERYAVLPPSSSPLLLYLDRDGDARFVDDSKNQSVACSEERTPQTLARASAPDRLVSRPTPAPAVKAAVAAGPDRIEQPVGREAPPAAAPCATRPRYAYTFHPDRMTEPVLRTARLPSEVATGAPTVVLPGRGDLGEPSIDFGAEVPVPLVGTSEDAAAERVAPDVVPSAWQPWVASLVDLRNAIRAIPAVPMHLWVGGAATLALLCLLRIWTFGWRIRNAVPAERSVRRLVGMAAARLGLRRAPAVLMVEDRVSPMICCSWRPRLILPRRLWDELDEPGRAAVVCHELAHLRRHDHL